MKAEVLKVLEAAKEVDRDATLEVVFAFLMKEAYYCSFNDYVRRSRYQHVQDLSDSMILGKRREYETFT